MKYRNCKVCGDIPKSKKNSICGACMDNGLEFSDGDDYTPEEVKIHRNEVALYIFVIFFGMLFIVVYGLVNFKI